jgi:hypothetical protein
MLLRVALSIFQAAPHQVFLLWLSVASESSWPDRVQPDKAEDGKGHLLL